METTSPDLAARLEALAARRASTTTPRSERTASALSSPSTPSTPSSPRPKRRRHPAKGARTAALGLSLASTGTLSVLFALANPASSQGQSSEAVIVSSAPAAAATTTAATAAPTAATAAPTAATATATATATAAPAATTTVDGATFTNRWGNVQVQATFAADGSLVDVTVLQSPNGDGRSVQINNQAVPQLNSEALTAGNAHVDTVSGATYTSTGYQQSLQSAIDAARDAGLTTLA